MRWLLIEMYLDILQTGWAVWDEEIRDELLGSSLPPIAIGPNQVYEILFWLTVQRAAAIRRLEG